MAAPSYGRPEPLMLYWASPRNGQTSNSNIQHMSNMSNTQPSIFTYTDTACYNTHNKLPIFTKAAVTLSIPQDTFSDYLDGN